MIKLYSFILLLCFSTTGYSQFWQDEAVGNPLPLTPVSSYTGWTNQGMLDYSGTAVVDTANPSNNSSWPSSGSGNILFTNTPGTYLQIAGFPSFPDIVFLETRFNVHGYDINNPNILNDLIITVSLDSGLTWSTLPCDRFGPASPPATATPWDAFYTIMSTSYYNYTPSPFDDDYVYADMSDIFIRFTQTSSTNTYRIDDIYVSGVMVLNLKINELSAVSQDNSVFLKWKANSVNKDERFVLERSSDAINFIEIATQYAKGNGEYSYEYVDEGLHNKQFYRVRMIEVSGKTTYSKMAVVEMSLHGNDLVQEVYPVPARSVLHIPMNSRSAQEARISLTDITGKTVLQTAIHLKTGMQLYDLDMQRLGAGIYQLAVAYGDKTEVRSITIH